MNTGFSLDAGGFAGRSKARIDARPRVPPGTFGFAQLRQSVRSVTRAVGRLPVLRGEQPVQIGPAAGAGPEALPGAIGQEALHQRAELAVHPLGRAGPR